MGGFGSTRWGWHTKADTAEESLVLDVADLSRKGFLPRGASRTFSLAWTAGARTRGSVQLEVNTLDGMPRIRLSYNWRDQPMDYLVELLETEPNYGGSRWWFRCPLSRNGISCSRRVGKLFLPPGARWFGCRKCYGITYASCEHDKSLDRFLHDPEAAIDLLERPAGKMPEKSLAEIWEEIRALQALEKIRVRKARRRPFVERGA